MREAVSNTSPLLYLHQLRQLELLEQLYGKIIVPAGVVTELAAGKALGHDVPDVKAVSWIEMVQVPSADLLLLATDLGNGEREAIALAQQRNIRVLLDDALARRHADLMGVRVTGTLGVLLKAKRAGHLPSIAGLIEQLTALGFYLAPQTRDAALRLANES
jgi:predicted nucleic acid-binding protein